MFTHFLCLLQRLCHLAYRSALSGISNVPAVYGEHREAEDVCQCMGRSAGAVGEGLHEGHPRRTAALAAVSRCPEEVHRGKHSNRGYRGGPAFL